jgi:hypothetical protein
MSFEPDFIWIVAKASAFGRSLVSFSDDDRARYISLIGRNLGVDVEIDEEDEPGGSENKVYFDGPAFVFRIKQRRLGIINDIEELARCITPTTPRGT